MMAELKKTWTQLDRFARFAWVVVVLNIFVIVWGGYVSASGSGDGCGSQWPLCGALTADSNALPIETIIEFVHRATSGLALLAVVALFWKATQRYASGSLVLRAAKWSLAFMVIESLLGAALVLFQWVDTNESLARAFVQPVHLSNTLLLMASLVLTAWGASGYEIGRWNGRWAYALGLGLASFVILSSFGTFASLASTIFPSESFLEGVQKDFARNVHYLIRLRIWHPMIATILLGYLFYGGQALLATFDTPSVRRLVRALWLFFGLQYGLGMLNAFLLAPIWLQMVHLLNTHLIWLVSILLCTSVLAMQAKRPLTTAPNQLAVESNS